MVQSITNIRKVWNNSLTVSTNLATRKRLENTFPIIGSYGHDLYLGLAKYIDSIPECFYSKEALSIVSKILEFECQNNLNQITSILNDCYNDINRALIQLNEVANEGWHDTEKEDQDYLFMRICDHDINPNYLKLSEGVFQKFIYPIAVCIRKNANKGIDDLWRLSACIDVLDKEGYSELTKYCDSVVRNSIAHGRITYKQGVVEYHDKGGTVKSIEKTTIYEIVDGLLDVCNGCALAYKMFYLKRIGLSQFNVPQQILLEELQAETQSPYWHIEGCLEFEFPNQKHLVIYAKPNSYDKLKVEYISMYSAVLAEYFAPGYDFYNVSFSSQKVWIGGPILNGKLLNQIRKTEIHSIKDYVKTVGNFLVFYTPKIKPPRMLCKIETLWMALALQYPLHINEWREETGYVPIDARQAKMHRNSWGIVLDGKVYIDINGVENVKDVIKNEYRRIVRIAKKLGRKNMKWYNIEKYLPIGFARISVYNTNKRKREMYGLDASLICTVQLQRISRIQSPDIMGSEIENVGQYRIAWNKAWLDKYQN